MILSGVVQIVFFFKFILETKPLESELDSSDSKAQSPLVILPGAHTMPGFVFTSMDHKLYHFGIMDYDCLSSQSGRLIWGQRPPGVGESNRNRDIRSTYIKMGHLQGPPHKSYLQILCFPCFSTAQLEISPVPISETCDKVIA